jgi:hypothetical protein
MPKTATRQGQVLSGVGWTLALLAVLYFVFSVVMATLVSGHWADVLRIGVVCLAASGVALWLIRTGRAR